MNYPKTRKAVLKYFRLCLDMQKAVGADDLIAAAEGIETSVQEFKEAFVEEDTVNSPQNRALAQPYDRAVLVLCELPDAKGIFEGLKNGTLTD